MHCIIYWTSAIWSTGRITILACCCSWMGMSWGIYWETVGGSGGDITDSFSSASLRRYTICSTIAFSLWNSSSSIVMSVSCSSWCAWQKCFMKLIHVLSVVGFLIYLMTSLRKIGCLDTIKYPMLTSCLVEYRKCGNSVILHKSFTKLKMSSIGSLTLYASFFVLSYFFEVCFHWFCHIYQTGGFLRVECPRAIVLWCDFAPCLCTFIVLHFVPMQLMISALKCTSDAHVELLCIVSWPSQFGTACKLDRWANVLAKVVAQMVLRVWLCCTPQHLKAFLGNRLLHRPEWTGMLPFWP